MKLYILMEGRVRKQSNHRELSAGRKHGGEQYNRVRKIWVTEEGRTYYLLVGHGRPHE